MDVLQFNIWAKPGSQAALGHLGTIVLGKEPNDAGEMLVSVTLRRKAVRKLRGGRGKIIDKGDQLPDTAP